VGIGQGTDATSPSAAVLELRNISKAFGSNRALDHVDLSLYRGEVVALVGQNGSGKSTLVKILSGFHAPEPGGTLLMGGNEVPLPVALGKAGEIGCSFVYQNLALATGITVLENLNLGSRVGIGMGTFAPIAWRKERREAAVVLRRYRVELDPGRRVGELPPVDQARLAIVRAAEDLRRYRDRSGNTHSLLVLDEPTVFLPEEDIAFLFELVRTVVAEGAAVLFISHDLVAVREIADRIVVLRDGRRVADVTAGEVDEDALVELIVGVSTRAAGSAPAPGAASDPTPVPADPWGVPYAGSSSGSSGHAEVGQAVAVVEHLAGGRLRDLSLRLAPGEIVGVAGLIGSGAEDVPYLLFGSAASTGGTLELDGEVLKVPGLTPERCVA
ncbi:MAG: ATP-binding cassette domain-containing protein, partial [Acidimicrobiales bacterium]